MIKLPPIKKLTKDEYMNLIATAIENSINEKCLIIFFGSIITNSFNRTSDIDVAIFCKKKTYTKRINKDRECSRKSSYFKGYRYSRY